MTLTGAPQDPVVPGHQGSTPNGSPPIPSLPAGGAEATLLVAMHESWRAFVRQVLAHPLRIGTLLVLGASVAVVLVGARGWWIVLCVVLFQAAASGLVALWLDSAEGSDEGDDEGDEGSDEDDRWRVPRTPAPRNPESPTPEDAPEVPDQRIPDPDE